MVWNYHDDHVEAPPSAVEVLMQGIPAEQVLLHHYRIDKENSNSYQRWKEMGSPQDPTAEQVEELEKAGQLQLLTSPKWLETRDGKAVIQMQLPRQGVSLLRLSW